MKTLISLGFLFILILHAGAFGVQSAWGNDLNITLENEVAGITPDMEFLAPEKGTLLGNGNPGMMVTSGSYSYLKKDSKVERAYFPQKQNLRQRRNMRMLDSLRRILFRLAPSSNCLNKSWEHPALMNFLWILASVRE